MKFKNKLIIVTGGSSGIGRQIVKELILEGAIVAVLSRREGLLNKVLSEEQSERVHCFKCDISNKNQVKKTFGIIDKKLGSCYGLINNAGINPSRNNILETSYVDWENTLNVNLSGAFNCSKLAIPLMLKNKSGSIVNIASIAGMYALEKRTSYMASKWGMLGLSSSLAIDFAKSNIRVNCICPGYVKTPLVSKYIDKLSKIEKKNLLSAHLLGRLGNSEDISKAVLFLLSDDASWITGAVLPVDGGFSVGKIIK